MLTLLTILALLPYSLSMNFAFDHETNVFLGSYDDYPAPLLESRIVETNSTFKAQVFENEPLSLNLGINDWGPMSTNLLMMTYPKDYVRPLPPCSISQSDISYHLIHEKEISKIDKVYDYVIHKNLVYVLTDTVDLFFYETKTTTEARKSGDNLDLSGYKLISAGDSFEEHFKDTKLTTGPLSTAGIAHDIKSDTLWMATNMGSARFSWPERVGDEDPKVSVKYFDNKTQMPSHDNVIYFDIK